MPWAEVAKITDENGEEVSAISNDGQKVITPCRLKLPQGKYTIYFVNSDNQSLDVPVSVVENEVQEIKQNMPGFDYQKILSSF